MEAIDVVPDVNVWVGLYQGKPGSSEIIARLARCHVHSNVHILTVTERVLIGLGEDAVRVAKFMAFARRLVADSGGELDTTEVDYAHDGELAYQSWRFSGTDLEDEAVVSFISKLSAGLRRPVTLITMDRDLLSYCEDRKVRAVNRATFLTELCPA